MTFNRTHIAVLGLASVCGALMVASATKAQPPSEPISVEGVRQIDPETQRVVHFADLNLANQEGRQVLIHRVTWTINDLCDNNGPQVYILNNPNRECLKTAWNSAKPQLDQAFANAGTAATVAIAIIAAPQK